MADQLQVNVHYEDDVYRAAVDPAEEADQLLVRSLYHFGIETSDKGEDAGWRLRPRPGESERTGRSLTLRHPIGAQVDDGEELILERDVSGHRRMSTGGY